MREDYAEFLARKAPVAQSIGIEAGPLPPHLFDYQAECVRFALKRGRAAMFLDTGLGKTAIQLEWCRQAADASNGMALLLTPLAVARQIEREAHRFGYEARVIRQQSDAGPGINICNYDRLDLLQPDAFGAVSLDESSILKSFTGATTRALIAASPVWMNTRETDVLNAIRAPGDEKHICPMPLDLTERATRLWSNPGDVVLSPFTGIGSEGVVALRNRRKFVGVELKDAYFRQAARHLDVASRSSGTLFDSIGTAA